jgi:uncharacterized protein YkwD
VGMTRHAAAACPPPASLAAPPEPLWEALCRTARAVRAPDPPGTARGAPNGRARAVMAGALLAGAVSVTAHLNGQPAAADSAADSDLFSLTNQDRASNGVAALGYSSTLQYIGENAPYSGCSGAGTIRGRAQDMLNRDYFSHQIPPCGQYVWPMMSAYGVHYISAGENIGWVSGEGASGSAAQWINTAFMNSSDHRANILNPQYTDLGVGSAVTGAGQTWTCPGSEGCSGNYQQVWIFAEEFSQLHSSAPPPPPHSSTAAPTLPPAPPSTRTPTPTPPPTPSPAATAAPSPPATPSPAPPRRPATAALAEAPLPAYDLAGQGLLTDTIESTLEAVLFG